MVITLNQKKFSYLAICYPLDKVIIKVYNEVVMAKYDTLRKLDRNKMLQEYAKSHPELSLKEIGQRFNISASRVWRILHNNKGEEWDSTKQEIRTGSGLK